MFRNRPRVLSPRTLGLIFLIPGLVWGIPALITGTFTGAAMGFCTFSVLGGCLMLMMHAAGGPPRT